MASFIELHAPDGTPVSFAVDHIVEVCDQHGVDDDGEYHCGITTSNQDADNLWPVREHYHAVLALLGMAGCKVVR